MSESQRQDLESGTEKPLNSKGVTAFLSHREDLGASTNSTISFLFMAKWH